MHRTFHCYIRFLAGILLCGGFSGCKSKKPSQYPADHARHERIMASVEVLRTAYESKESAVLEELLLPLKTLQDMQEEIKKDFVTYSRIVLKINIERITIKGERARVNFRWQGEWLKNSAKTPLIKRGHGILVWSGTQVVLLAEAGGDLPFGMASREAMS